MQELLDLIGAADGAERPFDEWVVAARQAGLRPETIQNLKRRGVVHTRLAPDGTVIIVRGAKPAPVVEG